MAHEGGSVREARCRRSRINLAFLLLFHHRQHLFRLSQAHRIFLRALKKASCRLEVVSFQCDGSEIEQSERLLGIFRQGALEQRFGFFQVAFR